MNLGKVFLTGGTGSFGRAFAKKLIELNLKQKNNKTISFNIEQDRLYKIDIYYKEKSINDHFTFIGFSQYEQLFSIKSFITISMNEKKSNSNTTFNDIDNDKYLSTLAYSVKNNIKLKLPNLNFNYNIVITQVYPIYNNLYYPGLNAIFEFTKPSILDNIEE